LDAKTFYKTLDSVDDIPTLPSILMEVNRLMQDDEASIRNISAVIEKDLAMTTEILKLVNSSFYGFKSMIRDIPHAVVILGFNAVRNALLSVSIIKTFSGRQGAEGFDVIDFWRHAIAVAVVSRFLAEKTQLAQPDDCFVAGLLHDIGKLVFCQYFTQEFLKVWNASKDRGLSLYEAEKELLPVTHAQLGGYLVEKWQFPASLVEAIRFHHALPKNPTYPNLLLILHAANRSVHDPLTGLELPAQPQTTDPRGRDILAQHLESVSAWFPSLEEEIESANQLFLKDL
jgi:putative nucleotidyltransferase with HDIG domain